MRRMRHLKPREIQGCQLALDASIATSLYDATSGGSLVATDGAIGRWEDQSGGARHATATLKARPIRKVGVINGCDAVRFDGVNDVITYGTPSSVAPSTIVFAAKMISIAAEFEVLMSFGAGTSLGSAGTIVYARTPGDARMSSYTTAVVNSNYTPSTTSPFCAAITSNTTSGGSFAVNNAAQGTWAGSSIEYGVREIGGASAYGHYSNVDFAQLSAWGRVLDASVRNRIASAFMRKTRISG